MTRAEGPIEPGPEGPTRCHRPGDGLPCFVARVTGDDDSGFGIDQLLAAMAGHRAPARVRMRAAGWGIEVLGRSFHRTLHEPWLSLAVPPSISLDPAATREVMVLMPRRVRTMLSQLRVRLRWRAHLEQWRWIGEWRSTTWWHRAHSSMATFSHSRDRPGRGSEISLVAPPGVFSTRPAPARRSQNTLLIGSTLRAAGDCQVDGRCGAPDSPRTGTLAVGVPPGRLVTTIRSTCPMNTDSSGAARHPAGGGRKTPPGTNRPTVGHSQRKVALGRIRLAPSSGPDRSRAHRGPNPGRRHAVSRRPCESPSSEWRAARCRRPGPRFR